MLERDDRYTREAVPASVFFEPYEQWPEAEREVVDSYVRGRVLDLGCGAGRHALELQRRGHDVVAIDISPGAVEVARRRGVVDARLLALEAVGPELGISDTVLMMCGNFGLVGSEDEAVRLLGVLASITSDSGRMVLNSVDARHTDDPRSLAYHARNVTAGRLPGRVTIRLRYRSRATPWFDLLNVSVGELRTLVAPTPWAVRHESTTPSGDVYAVLEKRRRV